MQYQKSVFYKIHFFLCKEGKKKAIPITIKIKKTTIKTQYIYIYKNILER